MVKLTPEAQVFVTERHIGMLASIRADGTPHLVPVSFTWDQSASLVRINTDGSSFKARNLAKANERGESPRVSVCQVDGGRWLTLEGSAQVLDQPAEVAESERRYARRYREPRENPGRVVIQVSVDKVMGSPYMVI